GATFNRDFRRGERTRHSGLPGYFPSDKFLRNWFVVEHCRTRHGGLRISQPASRWRTLKKTDCKSEGGDEGNSTRLACFHRFLFVLLAGLIEALSTAPAAIGAPTEELHEGIQHAPGVGVASVQATATGTPQLFCGNYLSHLERLP